MLERGWYDEPFVRRRTNAPLLVRTDTGHLLRAEELAALAESRLALSGTLAVPATDGQVRCRPVLEHLRMHCEAMTRDATEAVTGVPAARGISAGDWVRISTPNGAARARAKLNAGLDPGVVCAQHGWSQGCDELDLPPSDAFELGGVNLNLVLRQTPSDPISGSSPLRASLCDVTPG